MNELTLEELRGFIPDSALDDTPLQQTLDGAQEALDDWAGPIEEDEYEGLLEVTEELRNPGRTILTLLHRVQSVVEVVDTVGDTDTTLEADDYWARGNYLHRATGHVWGEVTAVTYVPHNTRNIRRLALVMLVKLELNYQPGIGGQGAGPWNENFFGQNLPRTRQDILEMVRPNELFA